MSASSAGRARGYLIASALWLVIVAVLALAYRGWVQPRRHQNLTAATSARQPYLQEIAVGGDHFSGYALLRSPAFRADLQREGLRLRWVEDSGDVAARLESLRTGELHLAAMSLDALLTLGARVGFPGAIVLVLDIRAEGGPVPDVLIARREFLRDQPERVQAVLAAEARALWQYRHPPAGLRQLVREDAQNHGTALTEDQAEKIAAGIQWQNVQENYAFFQLLPSVERAGLPGLEELIADRTEGLMRTQNLTADPLAGRRHSLYYDRPLAALQTARFHPGRPADRPRPEGAAAASPLSGRSEPEATALREEEWQQLRPLAELRTEPIVFSRGSAELSIEGQPAPIITIRGVGYMFNAEVVRA